MVTSAPCANDAEGTPIRALDVGKPPAELDEGEPLQQVGEHRSEHRHIEEDAADERAYGFAAHGEPHHQHHGEPKQAAGNEGHVRRLVLAVRHRQEMRELARA
jgi:hypothetical protein